MTCETETGLRQGGSRQALRLLELAVALAFAFVLSCSLGSGLAFAKYNEVAKNYPASQPLNSVGDMLTGGDIPEGSYLVPAMTTSSMCKMFDPAEQPNDDDPERKAELENKCILTSEGGNLYATFYISKAYSAIYLGTDAEAAAATNEEGTDGSAYLFGDPIEGYVYRLFTIPVPQVNEPFTIATYTGGKNALSGVWYTRDVLISSTDELMDIINGVDVSGDDQQGDSGDGDSGSDGGSGGEAGTDDGGSSSVVPGGTDGDTGTNDDTGDDTNPGGDTGDDDGDNDDGDGDDTDDDGDDDGDGDDGSGGDDGIEDDSGQDEDPNVGGDGDEPTDDGVADDDSDGEGDGVGDDDDGEGDVAGASSGGQSTNSNGNNAEDDGEGDSESGSGTGSGPAAAATATMHGVKMSFPAPDAKEEIEVDVSGIEPVEPDTSFRITLPMVIGALLGALAIGGIAFRAIKFRREFDFTDTEAVPPGVAAGVS